MSSWTCCEFRRGSKRVRRPRRCWTWPGGRETLPSGEVVTFLVGHACAHKLCALVSCVAWRHVCLCRCGRDVLSGAVCHLSCMSHDVHGADHHKYLSPGSVRARGEVNNVFGVQCRAGRVEVVSHPRLGCVSNLVQYVLRAPPCLSVAVAAFARGMLSTFVFELSTSQIWLNCVISRFCILTLTLTCIMLTLTCIMLTLACIMLKP